MTSRLLAALALPALLAGCVSFGGKPPKTLMTLAAAETIAPGTARTAEPGRSVVVAEPTVPQALATLRVPVVTGANGIAYLKDAQWVEAPSRLFRTLLAETIAARSGRVALDPRQFALAPGARLGGRMTQFGLDAPRNEVVVGYDATLVRQADAALETRRFEARAPVTAHDAPTVAAAMNQAANRVAADVADWVGR